VIGSLRGVVIDRSSTGELLVEVAGVGYRVQVTPATLASVATSGPDVFLHCHHIQREDAQLLYGFLSSEERLVFDALLSAQGVGPSMALGVLSEMSPAQLRMAVATGDVDGLRRVKGVGAKTAARIVIDLKSKLSLPDGDLAAVVGEATGTSPSAAAGGPNAEVRAALSGLGYSSDEIRVAMAELNGNGGSDASSLLRQALQRLGSRHA
jgi:holliday junction DNA helicase RuvA